MTMQSSRYVISASVSGPSLMSLIFVSTFVLRGVDLRGDLRDREARERLRDVDAVLLQFRSARGRAPRTPTLLASSRYAQVPPEQVLGGLPRLTSVSADFGMLQPVALLTSASATDPVVFTFCLADGAGDELL